MKKIITALIEIEDDPEGEGVTKVTVIDERGNQRTIREFEDVSGPMNGDDHFATIYGNPGTDFWVSVDFGHA